MNSTKGTKVTYSVKFRKTVREYKGFVIVPVEVLGSRGGTKTIYEIWSYDQQSLYNRKIPSLSEAKRFIDLGTDLNSAIRKGIRI